MLALRRTVGIAIVFLAEAACSPTVTSPDSADLEVRPDGSVAPSPDLPAPPDLAQPPDLGGPTLTLTLDPSLDAAEDVVKVIALTAAELLDARGAHVATGKIAPPDAVFSLLGLSPGDYFVVVNGDLDDLVPTRIDDLPRAIVQRVGATLRPSFIGPPATPIYRVRTYSAGQNQSSVVRFSDGSSLDEQPYVLAVLGSAQIEVRALGSGRLVTSIPAAPTHDGPESFAEWLLNTDGKPHHGDAFKDDPVSCVGCHSQYFAKPQLFSDVWKGSGWCYRCHYGIGGSASGFVDPSQ